MFVSLSLCWDGAVSDFHISLSAFHISFLRYRILQAHGADVTGKTNAGSTARKLAQGQGKNNILIILDQAQVSARLPSRTRVYLVTYDTSM